MDPINKKPVKFRLRDIFICVQMPRMHSSSGQCCLCVVGVFMFLAGVIMVAIGICLILNYGLFDSKLLPPELQSDDGKRVVGIILTTCGFTAAFISVLVSSFYLCTRNKPPTVEPLTLSSIPNTARRKTSVETRSETKVSVSKPVPKQIKLQASGSTMHSTSVPHSRIRKAKMKRQKLGFKANKKRLEGIKETDVISRRQSEIDVAMAAKALEEEAAEEAENTTRSDSLSQGSYQSDVFSKDLSAHPPIMVSEASGDSSASFQRDDNSSVTKDEAFLIRDNCSTPESGYTESVLTDKGDSDHQNYSLLD